MILFGILLVLVILGLFIALESYDYDTLGWVMVVVFGVWGIFHTIEWVSASYDYDVLVVERNSYQETLNNIRENGNDLETATIASEIMEFNRRIEVQKRQNQTWFYDCFIDDRIDELNPIK